MINKLIEELQELVENNTLEQREILVIEECSELTKAICKRRRGKVSVDLDILDECADVIVVVTALILKLDVKLDDVLTMALYKVERAKSRKDGYE